MPPKLDIAQKIKFIDLCGVLEKIQKAEGAQNKEKHLRRYIESFREFSKKFTQENGNDCESTFYCILRCLIPNADDARDSYNLRKTTIGNLYVKILNLSPKSDDAQKLYCKTNVSGCSDYADVVYSVMRSRANNAPSTLTLAEVHKLLDIISEADRKKVECELTKFIQITSAMEQKWLIRIILKSMHLNIGEQKIFSLYHPHAKDIYIRHTDLYKVCSSIEKGENLDLTSDAKPFQHIRPMLCGTIFISKLGSMFETATYYLETKLDGERCHLHIDDEEFKYISRNGKNYTENYAQNLTPLIGKLFNFKIKNIILDGEMMVWDKSTKSFHVKGEGIDVKYLPSGGKLRPYFVAYDLLYLNDKSYLDFPYVERATTLRKILKEEIGVFGYSNRTKILNVEHFMDLFNDAVVKRNEEGVVLKNQLSLYQPGSRSGGWYKFKPDYIDGIASDFDLLIIGGLYNKSKTEIHSYILGVCKKSSNENEMPTFHSVGSINQNLSELDQEFLNETFNAHWQKSNFPDFLEWGAKKPDVWVNPKDSVILQIRAAELAPSKEYRTPFALRFPRIDAVRRDKIWSECMTLEEYEEYYKCDGGVKKISKRALASEDFSSKRLKSNHKKENSSNAYATKFQPDKINKVTDEFNGISICILSTYRGSEFDVEKLKEIIVKHGGKIVENPLLDTKNCFCVAGDMTPKVKKIKDTGRYNIVSLDWLLRAFKDDNVQTDQVRPKPREIICSTADMKEELDEYFDQYGDSYVDHVDTEEMQLLLQELDSQHLKPLLDSEIKTIEQELYKDDNPNFFRAISGYFYLPTDANNLSRMSALAKLIFESRGGQVVDDYSESHQRKLITFIFVDKLSANMMQFKMWLDVNFKTRMNIIKAVSCDWIFKCDRDNRTIDVADFAIKF